MRLLIQRVSRAHVSVEGKTVGEIGTGLCIFVGVRESDSGADADKLAEKAANLRIFSDENDKMNLSLLDIGGEALAVSQFTLYGDCRKGRRPSFTEAMEPAGANELYERFADKLAALGVRVSRGVFQAAMKVEIANEGPVTLIVESP